MGVERVVCGGREGDSMGIERGVCGYREGCVG